MCTATWCIYVMVHWIACCWLLRVETCRYMHNWQQINSCVWLKLYTNFKYLVQHIGTTTVNYTSDIFLSPCCSSFLLHVVANVMCSFLVSRQLVLLSALPEFLHFLSVPNVFIPLLFCKMQSRLMSIVFYSLLMVQTSRTSECNYLDS